MDIAVRPDPDLCFYCFFGCIFAYIGLQHRKGKIVFQSEYPQKDNCGCAAYLLDKIRASDFEDYPVDDCPGQTCRGVYVFAEHQRLLIDENVADHSSECAGYDSHDHRHPHRIVDGKGFVDSDDAEQREADAVEYKQDAVVADEDAFENNHSG